MVQEPRVPGVHPRQAFRRWRVAATPAPASDRSDQNQTTELLPQTSCGDPSPSPAGDVDLRISTLIPRFLEWARCEARRAPETIRRYQEALAWLIRYVE